jgi:hypothetical protein
MLGKTNPNWPLPNISWASAVTDRPQFAWFISLPVTWREWQNTDLFDFNSLFQKYYEVHITIFITCYRMLNKMPVQTFQLQNH